MQARLSAAVLQRKTFAALAYRSPPLRSFASTPVTREQRREEGDEEDAAERVQWLTKLQSYQESASNGLPSQWISTSFSRSSGPGGQNVNKVNTKAEVRLSLAAASKEQAGSPWMTRGVVRYLTQWSPYYIASSHSLLINSMKTRTQSANLQDALDKLQEHLQGILSRGIAGETSEEQRKRVKSLIAMDKARTRKSREKRAGVKKDRKVSRSGLGF